jgi:hypothetical protein
MSLAQREGRSRGTKSPSSPGFLRALPAPTLVHPPEIGIHGNSHMMMQDRNNLQVADVISAWIDRHAEGSHRNGECER